MKTLRERTEEALKNYKFCEDGTDLNGLIAFAYYLGKCQGVKEVCDQASAIFAEQRKRCEETRYCHLAKKIQGNIRYIYHSDYDQWIGDFGSDLTDC